jgi:hypothetical protein
MPDRTLLDNEQVADRLHVTYDWWMRNKRRLIDKEGFPGEVRGIPQRWDPAAVNRWLDAQMKPALRVEISGQSIADVLAEAEQRLIANASKVA